MALDRFEGLDVSQMFTEFQTEGILSIWSWVAYKHKNISLILVALSEIAYK